MGCHIVTRFNLYFGPHLHSVATLKANPFCKHSYPLASMMPCPSGFLSALVTATSSSSFFFFGSSSFMLALSSSKFSYRLSSQLHYPCVSAKWLQLCLTLWIIARQAPLSMGILQATILEWVSMPSFRGSS